MASKPEEPTPVASQGAGLLNDAVLEKQPEPSLTAEPTEHAEKKENTEPVDSATAGVADLSVDEKKPEEEKKVEEEKKDVEEKDVEEKKETEEKEAEKEEKAESKEESKTEVAAPSDTTAPATEAAAVPASDAKPEASTAEPTNGPVWPETAPDHPLTKFYDAFEALITEAQHNEVYGIELSKSNAFHTKLILQKFLRANQNDLTKAKAQLLETLKWRKTFDPIKAAGETYEKSRFEGLGYVLEVEGVPESPNKKDVATFNIYGAVKDNKATFGDLDG